MVITGCTPWTLYEHDNYEGQSICWYPNNKPRCSKFVETTSDMNNWAKKVSSVRKGCHSRKKFYGQPFTRSIFGGNGAM